MKALVVYDSFFGNTEQDQHALSVMRSAATPKPMSAPYA